MADLVGVAFSNSVGSTGTSARDTHVRIDNPVGSNNAAGNGVLPQQWWGAFGCDFTRWTAGGTVHFNQITRPAHFANIGGAGQPALPTFFIVDGMFSPNITTGGFDLNSNAPAGAYDYVTGRGFNPRFIDEATRANVTGDIDIDFGTNTVWLAQAARDFNTLPGNFAGGVRTINADNGYVIQTATRNDTANVVAIAAPSFTDTLPFWTYSHTCYTTADGSVSTTPVDGQRAWTNSMQFGDTQDIAIASEATLLNGNTEAEATTLATAGTGNLRDAYSIGKALAVDGNLPNFSLSGTNDPNVVGTLVASGDVTLTNAANSSIGANFVLRVLNNAIDGQGTAIFANNINVVSGVTISNMILSPTGTAMLDADEIGAGVTLGEGTFAIADLANLGAQGQVILRGNPTINVTGNAIDIRQWNTQGNFTLAAAAPVTVTLTEAQATAAGQTIAPGGAPVTVGNITYTVPALNVVYQVPASLRNGVIAAKDVTAGTTILTPTVVNATTFQVTLNSADHAAGNRIRLFWRPNATETAAYNTTIVDVASLAYTTDNPVPIDFQINQIPNALWANNFEANIETNVGAASMNMIEDGDEDVGGVDRAELQFVNASGILDHLAFGAARTMYVGFTALNDDPDYLLRFVDNDTLTGDYILPAGNELEINGAFAYLDSGDANQQRVTAITNTNPAITGLQFVPKTFTLQGGGTIPTVAIINNPDGVTVAQITSAIEGSVIAENAQAARVAAEEARNQSSYLVTNGDQANPTADRLIGLRPKRGNFVKGTNYTENL